MHKLKEQEAISGISTDPGILIQIEDLEGEIAGLENQRATASDDKPLPGAAPAGTSPVSEAANVTHIGTVNIGDVSGGTLNLGENNSSTSTSTSAGGDIVSGDKRTVNTGGGAYIEGGVNTGGGDFVGRDKITYSGADAGAIATAFAGLYQALAEQPETMQKTMAKQAVETLEAEAQKGEQADEKKVKEGLEVILSMLPDIGEVAINTFINPIQGISTAFQKIARKASERK